MLDDSQGIEVSELLAMLGEQMVISRKQNQRISELAAKIRDLQEIIRRLEEANFEKAVKDG